MSENSPSDIYAVMNERLVPYGVSLELTARCNLDCKHCYHVTCSGTELTTGEIKKLLDNLTCLGTMELTFTGGEPLLRSDFPSIISYAVNMTGFSVKLFSNLTLLTTSIADLLASLPMNRVETTILGPDKETHDSLTGISGSFEAMLNSIHMLKERGIRIFAKTVVMKPNRHKLDEMYRLAHMLDIPFRHDDTLFVESDGNRKPLSLQLPDIEILRLRSMYGGQPAVTLPGPCNAAKSVMSISPDGSVYPCGPFPEPAGNIRETSLADIWREAPVMKRFRLITVNDYRLCRDCVYLLRCNGCIAMGIGLSSGRKYTCRLAHKRMGYIA